MPKIFENTVESKRPTYYFLIHTNEKSYVEKPDMAVEAQSFCQPETNYSKKSRKIYFFIYFLVQDSENEKRKATHVSIQKHINYVS